MKSLRLNKDMRANILSNFLDKWDAANVAPEVGVDIKGALYVLANKVQQKVYGKYEGLIPVECQNTTGSIKIQWPTESLEFISFGYDKDGHRLQRLGTQESKVEYVFTVDDPLYQEYLVSKEAHKEQSALLAEHNKKRNAFKDQVKQVLDSVNTTAQLVEAWPEAEAFIPSEISNPSTINLPSVNLNELNKQL